MIRVLIADDQQLVRAGLRALMESDEGLRVVGEAADGREAVELARELVPDVVLMDIRMPRMDGLEAVRRIAVDPRLGTVRMIVVTTFETDEYVFQALRAGASGFLVKDTPPEQLLHALRVVAAGEALLSPSVTRRLIAEVTAQLPEPREPIPIDTLTEREREVMALIAAGLSNDQIAERLVMSPATARTHVSRILSKLEARDRAQLVVLAYESGLVRPRRASAATSPPPA